MFKFIFSVDLSGKKDLVEIEADNPTSARCKLSQKLRKNGLKKTSANILSRQCKLVANRKMSK